MYLKTIYKLALIGILSAIALAVTNVSSHIFILIFRLILFFFILTELGLLFKTHFIDKKIKEWVKNTGLFAFSLVVTFLLLESVFMFIPRSHGFGYSLAGKVWFAYYWKPINSYGYRDTEPVKGKKTVIFVGDSFTEGQGVMADERFSDVARGLFEKSRSGYSTINLGRMGYDTQMEYDEMTGFITKSKIKPDYIVLQYFGNDIDHAAAQHNLKVTGFEPYGELSFPAKVAFANSYLLNYFYLLNPKPDTLSYVKYVKAAYNSDTIFNTHLKEIKLFVDYAKTNNTKLLVTIFPYLEHVDLSGPLYVNKLKAFLDSNHVEYIDVSGIVNPIPTKERVVNSNDAHASPYVHKLVGEAIYNKILKMNTPL